MTSFYYRYWFARDNSSYRLTSLVRGLPLIVIEQHPASRAHTPRSGPMSLSRSWASTDCLGPDSIAFQSTASPLLHRLTSIQPAQLASKSLSLGVSPVLESWVARRTLATIIPFPYPFSFPLRWRSPQNGFGSFPFPGAYRSGQSRLIERPLSHVDGWERAKGVHRYWNFSLKGFKTFSHIGGKTKSLGQDRFCSC